MGTTALALALALSAGCSSGGGGSSTSRSGLPPGQLFVTPTTVFTASGLQGGAFAPASLDYVIENTGGEAMAWTAASSEAWAGVSLAGGDLEPGETATVTVSLVEAEARKLAIGTHSGSLNFVNVTNGTGTISVPTVLTVEAASEMHVTPTTRFATSGLMGGPFPAATMDYVVSNIGGRAMRWAASSTQSWAGVSSAGGVLNSGESVTVTVALDPVEAALLAVGAYAGTIDFQNLTDLNGSTTRRTTLTVLPPTQMTVTPLSLFLPSGVQGGPFAPQSMDYVIENTGGSTMAWSAETTELWTRLSSMDGSLDPGETVTVTLTLIGSEAAKLGVGVHTGSVDFVNETQGKGTTSRGFALDVRQRVGLNVSPQVGFASAGPKGGPFTPRNLSYTLHNSSSVALDWTASLSSIRFVLNGTGGTLAPGASTTLRVSVNQAGAALLVPGSYASQLSIVDGTNPVNSTVRPLSIDVRSSGAGGTMASVVTQFGIQWGFDKPYEVGQFANGDWWVVGPVTITDIDPPSLEVGGYISNGSMINPTPFNGITHGYDSTMYAQYRSPGNYEPLINAAAGVSSTSPLTIPANRSLVSTISREKEQRPQILTAAILTVLDKPAPAGSFRPAYAQVDKTIRFNESQLDYTLLGKLPKVASTPGMASVRQSIRRPWLDHVPLWVGRYTHPSHNMPDYGRDMAAVMGTASLMLQLDFTDAQKRDVLVSLVQMGIDFFGVAESGGGNNWRAAAGHMSGRKWPILFAGVMLGDPGMAGIGFDPSIQFGEDGQTFYVEETSPGIYNNGHGGYTAKDEGVAEWGTSHVYRPELDDAVWLGDPYRVCCTANSWWGQILSARIMGAQGLWNHDELFDYQDRYLTVSTSLGYADWRLSWTRFGIDMWRNYRSLY